MRAGTQLFINEGNVQDLDDLITNIKLNINEAFDSNDESVYCFETSPSINAVGFLNVLPRTTFDPSSRQVPHPFMNNFVYVNINHTAQPVWGFGTSLTDAAIIQLNAMPSAIADKVLDLQLGLQRMKHVRIPIGSCDFRPDTKPYSFARGNLKNVQVPETMDHSAHWEFWEEHFAFNKAEVERARWLRRMNDRHGPINITAAPWSAPPALKTKTRNAEPQGWVGGELDSAARPQVLVCWVNYLLFYVAQYQRTFGLQIKTLSLQNEPRLLPSIFAQTWETMFFSSADLAAMTAMTIDRIKELDLDVKLILFDDQKALLPDWIAPIMARQQVKEEVAKGRKGLVEAVGFHGYMWPSASHKAIASTKALYPTVPLVCTEFTTGFSRVLSWPIGPEQAGSSSHARQLLANTLLDIHAGSGGFIDWNMVLDVQGGPNWSSNFCDALLLWDNSAQHLIVQLACMFLAHITAFMRAGAQVVDCMSAGTSAPQAVAFRVQNKLVVVVNNAHSWFSENRFYMVVNGRVLRCVAAKGVVQTYVF